MQQRKSSSVPMIGGFRQCRAARPSHPVRTPWSLASGTEVHTSRTTGSRAPGSTCPWLTNSSVAVVAEYYSDNIQPFLEDQGTISPFVTSSLDSYNGQFKIPPWSKHVNDATHLKGNYLFLDGHVEFVNGLMGVGTYGQPAFDPLANQMFPEPPPNLPSGVVPCP